MTSEPIAPPDRAERRAPALMHDEHALGLRRQVVATSAGRVIVRAGRRTGGAATILLHGAAGSWTTWTPLLVASDHSSEPIEDVIAIDLPGCGESRDPLRPLDVAAMSDVVADVAQALGYTRWTLIGHSLGGFIALDLAARMPAATLRVELVSPSGAAIVDAVRRPLRGGIRLPAFAGMLVIMRMLAPFDAAGRAFVRWLGARGWLRALSAPLFADPAHVHHSVIEALAEEVRPASFARAARAAADYDLERWRSITCPVRSVSGERDVFVGVRDEAEFAARIADFHAEVIRGAGHFGAIEQPATVLELLR